MQAVALEEQLAVGIRAALDAHALVGLEPEEALTGLLIESDEISDPESSDTAGITHDVGDADDEPPSNVVSFPNAGGRWRPEHPIPFVGRQEWAYSTEEGRRGPTCSRSCPPMTPGTGSTSPPCQMSTPASLDVTVKVADWGPRPTSEASAASHSSEARE